MDSGRSGPPQHPAAQFPTRLLKGFQMREISTSIVSVAVAAFLVGFSAPGVRAEDGVTADKIVLGQAAALTGPAAELGLGMKVGLEAAFAEVNKAGGIKGRKLELKSVDDGYEPTRSIGVVKKLLTEDKVFSIIGTVGTPTAAAIQPITSNAGVPMIGAFSGVEFLREPYKPLVMNVRASYYQETEAMVEHLTKDLGYTRIGIMYQDDAYGQAGLAGLRRALDKRKMKLAGEGTYERNTVAILAVKDFVPLVPILWKRGIIVAKKPRENRVPIMMSDDELKAIDDWRFENRVATRSDAVRRLAQYGLHASESAPKLLKWISTAIRKYQALSNDITKEPSAIAVQRLREESAIFQTKVLMRVSMLMPNKMLLNAPIESGEVAQTAAEFNEFLNKLDLEKEKDRETLLEFFRIFRGKDAKPEE
jgi:hypothetical protein